jgi:hypothetical protein
VLDRLNTEGEQIEAINLPGRREHPITIDHLAHIMLAREASLAPSNTRLDSAQLLSALTVELQGLGDQLGDVFPEYADLQCAATGDIWLQLFDPESRRMGRGDVWLHIGLETRQTVRFPTQFAPFHFGEREVWGVLRDSLDIPAVARFALPAGRGRK